MLTVSDVSLRFSDRKLFDDVNIKFTEGNTYGLIGANGAGKSTFLKILAGDIEPTTGHISLGPDERLSVLRQNHFDYEDERVIDVVIMGNEKKSLKMTEHEKYLTAVHEVGHAIVGKMLAHTDPVHKISILPRGGAGGVTWFLPEKDRTYTSKAKYLDELACLYGGRVAEEVFFGTDYITTGASNDIERATDIARAMIMRFGFDKDLGAENYAPDAVEGNYLGAQSQEKAISQETRKLIDDKVRKILQDAYATATQIISENKDLHEKIAKDLFEKEEMLKDEFDAYFVDMTNVPEKIIK